MAKQSFHMTLVHDHASPCQVWLQMVSWYFEPSQPLRIISGLNYQRLVSCAFSPVNHKGLYQGWNQASKSNSYLVIPQVILLQVSFSQPTTQIISTISRHKPTKTVTCFGAYLFFVGTQYWNLHPAGWPILFCGPTQESVLATANTGKKCERFWKKMQVNGLER